MIWFADHSTIDSVSQPGASSSHELNHCHSHLTFFDGISTEKKSGHNRDSKGRFGPGNKGGGRPKGVPNKLTQNMKNLIQDELVRLGPDHFHAWALENPTEFYKIAARLIPVAREISGREGGPLEHRTIREYSTEELYRMIED